MFGDGSAGFLAPVPGLSTAPQKQVAAMVAVLQARSPGTRS